MDYFSFPRRLNLPRSSAAFILLFMITSGPLWSQNWDFFLSGNPEVGNPGGQGTTLKAYLGFEWPGGVWSTSLSAQTSVLARTEEQGPPERLLLTETSQNTEIYLRIAEGRLVPGFKAGLGVYQSLEDQLQSGYFRTAPLSPFQAFTLDFQGRGIGPMVTAAYQWQGGDFFRLNLSGVIVPAFWAQIEQTYVLEPALEGKPGRLDYGTWGAPYGKVEASADLWNLVSLGLEYHGYTLNSQRLKPGAGEWILVSSQVWNHSLLWTLGLSLNLGGRNWVKLGVGRKTQWILASDASPLTEGRTVLDLSFALKD